MYFVKMCAYIFEICTVVQSNAAAADDNNYSFYFHSLPPNAAARISGGMKFQMVNLVENILRPEAPACIHIIFHTFMLRPLYLTRRIHLNYTGSLVAVCVWVMHSIVRYMVWNREESLCRVCRNNVWLDNRIAQRQKQHTHKFNQAFKRNHIMWICVR